MKELEYFKYHGDPDITTALIGINREDWVCSLSSESKSDAISKMLTGKFDVLPIVDENGTISRYYTTKKWGKIVKEEITEKKIKNKDKLYYRTDIHDAIRAFCTTKRCHFFLDNQTEIVGLISLGNFNSKHSYLYMYNLFIQLEHSFDFLINNSVVTTNELLNFFRSKDSKYSKGIVKRFTKDEEEGVDAKFTSYLYFSQYLDLFEKFDFLNGLIEFSKFREKMDGLPELRNTVAHPTKSLVKDFQSLISLNKKIENMQFLLKNLSNSK